MIEYGMNMEMKRQLLRKTLGMISMEKGKPNTLESLLKVTKLINCRYSFAAAFTD